MKTLKYVLLILIVPAFFTFIKIYDHYRLEYLFKEGIKVEAEVERNFGDIVVSYWIEDRAFLYKVKSWNGYIKAGERYTIIVDTTDKYSPYLDFSSPLIDSSRALGYVCTVEISKSNDTDIEFWYVVNDQRYSRYQEVPDQNLFSEDKDYQVVYYKDDPEVAYLRLEICDK